jgi:hypothetical protein
MHTKKFRKKLDCDVKSEPPNFVATNLDGFMVCNIDDIFIFLKNMEDHECHVCLVLDKLEKVKFYAILKKCEFYQTKVEFLGYIILGNDICMDPCMVQTIMNWAIPTFVHDLQCFFRFTNFY